jgi:23S rRNA pseudouridine1911/1915/1917 synthase
MVRFSICTELHEINRAEVVLKEIFPDTSRRQFSKMLESRLVTRNGRTLKKAASLKFKDEVQFPAEELEVKLGSQRVDLKNHKLEIIFEDPNFLVVEKPRGMHSVLINSADPVTLADLIFENYPETLNAGRSPKESGLVQRLDFYSSGLLLVARNRETWENLHEDLINKNVTKSYLAFVEGVFEKNLFNPDYKIDAIEKGNVNSVINFTTSKGARHIVRSTCAELGFPLVGDIDHGSKFERFSLEVNDECLNEEGFFLHAHKITFSGNFEFSFESKTKVHIF